MGQKSSDLVPLCQLNSSRIFSNKNPLKSGVVIYSDQFRIWGCVTQCRIKIVCTECDFLSIGGLESVITRIFKLFHGVKSTLSSPISKISGSLINPNQIALSMSCSIRSKILWMVSSERYDVIFMIRFSPKGHRIRVSLTRDIPSQRPQRITL